ncbi:MAG: VTT domain-containing protein [Acidobacteria bacterium]|nr:VTT domain-containing protein [Acidobacteriota bacterium]
MKQIGRWLSQHILPFGAPGLFLLALVDSGLIPVPQGVDVLLFAQVVRNPGGALFYAALATVGSLIGCLFLYYISQRAGEMALARRTSPERVNSIRRQIEKYEALTLVLPAMIPLPLPMKLFVIAAGVFRVRLTHFVLAILFARVVRFFGIALIAQRYGEQTWTLIRQHALAVGIGAACLVALFYWISQRFR